MQHPNLIQNKVFTTDGIIHQVRRWRLLSKKIVFTNGCFDILHQGHLEVLSDAAAAGDILLVGVNTDASVNKLKGPHRPVNNENLRALMLASLTIVDGVILFGEDTPLELIKTIRPDVLVKGGDYTVDKIVGAKEVIAAGGEVKVVPLVNGYSTTALIEKIRSL
ncbi:MAG: D-glycero-beta-D-manno-heptose 1-phosphate adenylyltransferase [Bacteroidetes bacterium]|nr:MAG: D-glycero-beta-D-manno-heptose 1-phosphate adenylyltransferase [Bacteroidota bacterium]